MFAASFATPPDSSCTQLPCGVGRSAFALTKTLAPAGSLQPPRAARNNSAQHAGCSLAIGGTGTVVLSVAVIRSRFPRRWGRSRVRFGFRVASRVTLSAVKKLERRLSQELSERPAAQPKDPDLPDEVPQAYASLLERVLPAEFSWAEFVAASQRPLRPCIRVNPWKASVDSVRRYSAARNWRLEEPVPWTLNTSAGSGLWISVETNSAEEEQSATNWAPQHGEADLPELNWGCDAARFAGHIYIQEAASMLPVAALIDAFEDGKAPKEARVLDMAAAPGSKASALAAWVAPAHGAVVCNEPNASRSKALVDNLLRLGVMPWAAITQLDARTVGRHWCEEFDAIMLDAPCSGEGMMRRGAGYTDRLEKEKTIGFLASLQKQLALSAFMALKAGGVLVYSTCTLNPSENEDVIAHLEDTFGRDALEIMPLKDLPGVDQRMATSNGRFLRCWPQHCDTQGFFVARIRKLCSTADCTLGGFSNSDGNAAMEKRGQAPRRSTGSVKVLEKVARKDEKLLAKSFRQFFDCELPGVEEGCVLRRRAGGEFWCCPRTLLSLPAVGLRRTGIRVADAQSLNLPFAANFEWVTCFAHRLPADSSGVASLDVDAARAFCAGEDVLAKRGDAAAASRDGAQAIARFGDYVLGMGRWSGQHLHNDTPRHWRCEDIVL